MEIVYILFAVLFGVVFGACISYAIMEIKRDLQKSKPESDFQYWIELFNDVPNITNTVKNNSSRHAIE